ncbi:hypothetical protein VTG60DRAFT_1723 [Thermothelomyces hinnuleus]
MSSGSDSAPDLGTLRKVFWVLGVLGASLTWGRTASDGTVGHLLEILHGSHALPGSDTPLLDRFSGIPPLDYLLRTLVVFFWEAIDGSHPDVTATAIYFVGQLFPIIIAIYLDGLRRANGSSLAGPTIWFFVFGAAAIGASGAAWALAYTAASSLTTSPSASADDLRRGSLVDSPRAAALLLPATVLGYVVPVILMGLPSPTVVSDEFRQWSIVLWNTFPLLMLVIVAAAKRVLEATVPPSSSSGSASDNKPPARAHLRVVRWVAAVSAAVGFALHVAVATVSVSTALFPALFNDKHARAIAPRALAAPPLSLPRGDTVGDGIRAFMYWDQAVGYSLVLLVFLAQLRNALRAVSVSAPPSGSASASAYERSGRTWTWTWTGLVAASAASSLLLGPGTTVIAASWLRDEVLFGQHGGEDERLQQQQPNKRG